MKKDLSKDQIRDIIQMKADGYSITEIMDKYPFIKTRSTIYYHLYKAPAEKQNNMILLHKKLDDVLHKLQNIEQYLSMQSIVQNTVQDKPEGMQNNVQDIKPKTSIGEANRYIRTAELMKHICFEATGETPDVTGIRDYLKKHGVKIKDPKAGYPLKEVIKCLQDRNKNLPARASAYNISELEKLL
jgi:hypothetical protein